MSLAIDPKLLGQNCRKKPKLLLSGTQKESLAVEEHCKHGTICLSSDRRDLQCVLKESGTSEYDVVKQLGSTNIPCLGCRMKQSCASWDFTHWGCMQVRVLKRQWTWWFETFIAVFELGPHLYLFFPFCFVLFFADWLVIVHFSLWFFKVQ